LAAGKTKLTDLYYLKLDACGSSAQWLFKQKITRKIMYAALCLPASISFWLI
jgi:hypothetical protein